MQLGKEDSNELMKISLNILNEILNFTKGTDIEIEDIDDEKQNSDKEDGNVEKINRDYKMDNNTREDDSKVRSLKEISFEHNLKLYIIDIFYDLHNLFQYNYNLH